MKRILIVGGANGIGLSIAKVLSLREDTEKLFIIDKNPLAEEYKDNKIESIQFDLTNDDFSVFDSYDDIDGLIITAGFGKLSLFKDIEENMITQYFKVNTIGVIRVIKHFYEKLLHSENFYCSVMVSIAGFMSSPFF